MGARTVLIIGGNGIISGSVSRRAVELGWDVTLLNRGRSSTRPPIEGARTLIGDAGDPASIAAAVGEREFDVVVNFRSFLPEQVAADIELFGGRTGQYIYISSASAYQKPIAQLPIVESTPLRNPFWQYSRDKIASEDLLVAAYREAGFPATIVRPSHTYDETLIPLDGGWTPLQRMLDGKPIVIHGDGTSWWTLTHARDFARAFVGLFGNPHAIGSPVHITGDESLTWDEIARTLGRALGVEPRIVHIASESIAREIPAMGPGLVGDKAHSVLFDNTRIKTLVPGWVATTPFEEGAREIAEWYLADGSRRSVDAELDAAFDRLAASAG
ncbi:NAD-dependent epimerase/dehydratase family protein [Homoserinibacter sp. GY 40078]|uniref:NAD-dependent epimerase/dehydratase family protein n=1 Tax=Homoserinibacter sp. GY 40078 TaxID=2603275 RepID=UPI0011C85573|nr:NAD-dependent epimerase/dehydratase family protein [Homoserinibacter sp. GY 40078]TXK18833.1 NAD-dependent epimerase/dehydratase family protein [Homoserinibacter sp. GY 40078]